MNHISHPPHLVTAKPSIAKDALVGLISAISIGFLVSVLLILVVLLLSTPSYANTNPKGAEVGVSDVQQGSLLFRTDKPGVFHIAPTVDTRVNMKVSGMIVRSTVVQRFTNPDDFWVEGIYVFPLPDDASVDHMRMKIGERVVEGEIKEREAARKTYEAAKQQGKKVALIDQQRPNVFTNAVANIGPGEAIVIEIEYQQVLHYENTRGEGKFEVRFPMTMTPRYFPAANAPQPEMEQVPQQSGPVLKPAVYRAERIRNFNQVGWATNSDIIADAERMTPPFVANDALDDQGYASHAVVNPVSISVELNTGFPINQIISPYHTIHTIRQAQGKASIQLAQQSVAANRDFDLVWTVDSGYAPRAALFNEQQGDKLYNLIMVMPPTDGVADNTNVAREVIYIIDTSGSMEGTSLQQAKSALTMALARLRPADTFNIIQFNSITSALYETAQSATRQNIQQAQHYVNGLYATGGTEMLPALQQAFNGVVDKGQLRQVIFLTDGSVGNETQLFDLIKTKLGNSRLFTIGIGSAPNSYFMTRAAEFGRGTYTYIGSSNEVQNKMQNLFTKLESPVLTDLKVMLPDTAQAEVWPKQIPDLYLGEPVVIAIQSKQLEGNVRITGQRADSQWQVELPVRGGQPGSGVGVLWARAKIKDLMNNMAINASDSVQKDNLKKSIIDVALQHHLVSKYTSLVAVDKTPTRAIWDRLNTRKIPNQMPYGATMGMVVGSFAKTATRAQLDIIFGLVLVLFSLLSVWLWNRQGAWR